MGHEKYSVNCEDNMFTCVISTPIVGSGKHSTAL